MKMDELANNSDEMKEQSGNGDDEEEETHRTLSPLTPSPSSKGKRKKKLEEMVHVKSCDLSSKIIEKPPKLTEVLSDHPSKSERSKRVNSISKTCAMVRAEEVMSNLDSNSPTCLKTMVKSQVSGGFWMGLSSEFCKLHLPKKDLLLTVEDESGKEYEMIYIFQRTALSGGWRGFARSQKLHKDDIVIFQLVAPLEPIKLKVYIVRANDVANEDSDIGHLNLDAHKKQNDAVNSEKGGSKISEKSLGQCTTKRKLFKSLQRDTPQKKKNTGLVKSFSKTLQEVNKTENGDEESDLEIIPGPRLKRVNSISKTCALVRAEEVMSSLDPNFPTCLKTIIRSNVSGSFGMKLSREFCNLHLPKKDLLLTVEDESGKEYEIIYIFQWAALSGGYRSFARAQKLHEDDVVIFQLVTPLEPIKLKVYIIRANDAASEDSDIGHVNLDAHTKQTDAEKGGSKTSEKSLGQYTTKRKFLKSLQRATPQKKKRTDLGKSFSKTLQQANKSENGDEVSDLEIIHDPSNPPPQFEFNDVKGFQDFTIIVDEICIDSELPDQIRRKYYELCLAKKAFLHAHLMQDLNSKLIAGIISETVNIAESIKKCSLTTCRSEFANWERALKSFHFMGMSVGFIISRIRKLVGLAFESEDAIETRKYMAIKLERIRAEDQLVNFKSKCVELKETYKKYGGDVKALKLKAEVYEHKFQEEVDAPW